MVTFTDLRLALLKLGLSHTPVVAHASLKAFGEVVGGAETLLRAALDSVWALVMPTFTYRTLVTPEIGPPGNGITYGSERDVNRMAEPFTPDMPADKLMGAVAEALRCHSRARRTAHPILSFAGIQADRLLIAQTSGGSAWDLWSSGRRRRLGAASGCRSHRQHGHSLRRASGRASPIRPLGDAS